MSTASSLAKASEGCRLAAYQDAVGVWTIGWGHTGPDVHAGLVWTQAQADAALEQDLAYTQLRVLAACPRLAGHDNKLAAITDWSYNLGIARLRASTLRKRINSGEWQAVPAEISKWRTAEGRVLPGLVVRRAKEVALWNADE